jgi:hypothetical protein
VSGKGDLWGSLQGHDPCTLFPATHQRCAVALAKHTDSHASRAVQRGLLSGLKLTVIDHNRHCSPVACHRSFHPLSSCLTYLRLSLPLLGLFQQLPGIRPQHGTAQHKRSKQHSDVQHRPAQCSTPQHSTAQRNAAHHSTTHQSATQHTTAQYGTAQRITAHHGTICYTL